MAFPNDEPTAQVIASRLRAEGIASRIDRGLATMYQVAPVGQYTIFVSERDAPRALEIVGASLRGERGPGIGLYVVMGFLAVALLVCIGAVAVNVLSPR